MPARFVNIDRDTPLLLPPDLRDWVPQDHLAHFILDAVTELPLTTLHVNERGTGNEQFPPRMMLGLLCYCYAAGIFRSRAIEQATHTDVAVRFLTTVTHPDHDTIGTFRARRRDRLQKLQAGRAPRPSLPPQPLTRHRRCPHQTAPLPAATRQPQPPSPSPRRRPRPNPGTNTTSPTPTAGS